MVSLAGGLVGFVGRQSLYPCVRNGSRSLRRGRGFCWRVDWLRAFVTTAAVAMSDQGIWVEGLIGVVPE